MDINAKEQHILSTVDALQDDIVNFTQRLVA
jgi:hypothetical protein